MHSSSKIGNIARASFLQSARSMNPQVPNAHDKAC
ncbi:hypothetical protein APH_0598 [Anaplasma phagocytophilum str. HZ]|uniref:Uncharacterized protein n=1 Tax=Anaplasma phagocytophilum (strain HZ) TaxID=212042 RepID=Q2GKB3_ANAPZ|nr:hypothetical protein APH_0598 [Anaplasma phagocytophilum str. HZ]